MPEFDSGNSFRMKEDVSLVTRVGNRRGKVGSAVEVVMVIMTFDGTPTGGSRRIGTREIIFCSRLSSTGIVMDHNQGDADFLHFMKVNN